MPTYRMSAPDGQTYQIDGPEGASDEQVRAEIIKQNPHLSGITETTPAPEADAFQRPPSEGIIGSAIGRVVRGGRAVANAIYPPTPQAPTGHLEALKNAALGVGSGLMEQGSAITAPIGNVLQRPFEAIAAASDQTPDQMQADLARTEADLSRALQRNDALAVHQLQVRRDQIQAAMAKPPEQRAYEAGQAGAQGAEMAAGMFLGKPFGFRGPVAAETPAAAFLPRAMRPGLAAIPKPLPAGSEPIVDMSKLQEPPAPAPRQIRRPFEEAPSVLPEQPKVEPFTIPTTPEGEPMPTAAEAAQARTGGVIPPRQPEPSPILDAQGRAILPTPEPGQGTAELRVSPPTPETPLQPANQPSLLKEAGQIAEERTGGAVPPRVPNEPNPESMGQEAARSIREAMGEGETPTKRLIKKGKSISGGSDAEDVGWVTPEGKEVSHRGVRMSESSSSRHGYDMTHSESIQYMHGQSDIQTGFNNGYVRYVKAGNHLNVETGLPGIENAIQYISRNGRNARGGVIVEITDPQGRMYASEMFDKPWKAIEYLKGKQAEATPEGQATNAALNQQTRDLLNQIKNETPTTRLLRKGKGIGGASGQYSVEVEFANGGSRVVGTAENEAGAMRLAAQYAGADAKNVHITTPEGAVINSRNPMGLKDSGMILKELERRGIDDSLEGYRSVLPTITDTNQAKRIIKGDTVLLDQLVGQARGGTIPRTMRPISGGSGGIEPEEPLPSAREIGMRRAAQPEEKPATFLEQQAAKHGIEYKPEEASVPAAAPGPRVLRGSSAKTQLQPAQVEQSIEKAVQQSAEMAAAPKSSKNQAGILRQSWEKLKAKLPQEFAVLRARTDSPVITEMEQYHAQLAHRMKNVVDQPWWKEIKKLDPEEMKQLEATAVAKFKETGNLEESIKNWPEPLKEYIRFRNENLAEEQTARTALGLKDFKELPGPYLPRMTDSELSDVVNIRRSQSSQMLQTTVKSAQEHRKVPTMLEGEQAGYKYIDPRNAILIREYNGIKETGTARLINALKSTKGIFESAEEAKAVSPTQEAFAIRGLPGADTWYVPTRAEARFLEQNVINAPSGLRLPGLTSAKNIADVALRNPNLINPLPHTTKNMGIKYLLASGPKGVVNAIPDMLEYRNLLKLDKAGEAVPELYRQFREFMPYAEAEPAYGTMTHEMVGQGGNLFRRAANAAGALNKPSSNFIFKFADPSLRYSLFKSYVKGGMAPQEAANNAWIDLVRYGTRSDLVDFWKSIPINFFVPWRVGTYTSVAKQLIQHPVRAALTIAGIDMLREARYRETGRWTHLPWDYIEGPISLVLENPMRLKREAWTTAVFGPGGEATVANLQRALTPTKDTPKDYINDFTKVFWGISQFSDAASELFSEYQKDHDPSHFFNAAMAVLLAERQTKGAKPHRLGEFIPESVMPKDYSVKYKEATNPVNRLP